MVQRVSENLRNYTKAVFGFDAVVTRVEPDQWNRPSPCEGWSALDVVAHNIGMCAMIAGFASGNGAAGPETPEVLDPHVEWSAARDGVLASLRGDGVLQREADTPWGRLTIDRFLGVVTVDPLAHTFDLARATGQAVVIDAGLAAAALAQLERAGDAIRGPGRFAAAVEIDAQASIVDRFVAIAGRQP